MMVKGSFQTLRDDGCPSVSITLRIHWSSVRSNLSVGLHGTVYSSEGSCVESPR
jgi:hypothetical protein